MTDAASPDDAGADRPVVWCVMACHNRRERTLACLATVQGQAAIDRVALRTLVVDDGSTDGTAAAIAARFPEVVIVPGTGSLFWGGAMRRGIDAAIERGADALWLVNDDVAFRPEALARLVDAARHGAVGGPTGSAGTGAGRRWPFPWVVGAANDPVTGHTTYSGWVRVQKWRPRMRMLAPGDRPVRCDLASFNSVLLPAADYVRLGGIDVHFPHGYGDHDLSRRATRSGIELFLAPGFVGTCAPNPPPRWTDPTLSVGERIRDLHSRANRPPGQALRYEFRHYGLAAPLLFLRPYVRIFAGAVRPGRRRHP